MSKKISLLISAAVLVLTGAQSAFALTRTYTVDYPWSLEPHRGQSVNIAHELRRDGHYLNRDFVIESVEVKAKSRGGRGQIALAIGGDRSMPRTVSTGYDGYQSEDPYSFNRIHLSNPSYLPKSQQVGLRAMLEVRGHIKIKSITVRVQEQSAPSWMSIDSYKVGFEPGSRKTYRVRTSDRVLKIKHRVDKRHIMVQRFNVCFDNGRCRDIRELEGRHRQKSTKTFTLRAPEGRRITEIEITAHTLPGQGGRARAYLSILKQSGFDSYSAW